MRFEMGDDGRPARRVPGAARNNPVSLHVSVADARGEQRLGGVGASEATGGVGASEATGGVGASEATGMRPVQLAGHGIAQEPFTIVGSSPEALVTVADRVVTTHPIAGTRWRGGDRGRGTCCWARACSGPQEKRRASDARRSRPNDLDASAVPVR